MSVLTCPLSRRNLVNHSQWKILMAFDFQCWLSPRGHVYRQSPDALFNPDFDPKSPYWFNAPSSPDLSIPQAFGSISPLSYHPSSSPTCVLPIHSVVMLSSHPRLGSQTSWPTSSAGTHPTMSAWSFPPTQRGGSVVDMHAKLLPPAVPSRPTTPVALYTVQILGGL